MLIDRLGLTDIRTIKPDSEELARSDADGMPTSASPTCCHIRKTEPLERALHGFDAWIFGRKRFHGGLRANIPTLEIQDGRLKIEPLARFTAKDIENYIDHYGLPHHPLV